MVRILLMKQFIEGQKLLFAQKNAKLNLKIKRLKSLKQHMLEIL